MSVEDPDVFAVDLFCGAGGFTEGLERAGIDVVAGVDVDPDCEAPYEANHDAEFYHKDLKQVARDEPGWVGELFDESADVHVIAGGPPCQPYSTLVDSEVPHEKAGLVTAFAEIVNEVQPDIVAMENVYGVRDDGEYHDLVDTLENAGYYFNEIDERGVYCPEYGIPQQRKRWITLASRAGPIELNPPKRANVDPESDLTVADRIDHLPPIEAGEQHEDDPLHRARNLEEKNIERIEISKPGGDWTDWEAQGRGDLVADCHQKDSGITYKAPYSRMEGDEPAPTITTQFYNYGSGRFGHYDTDQDRALSIREGAILQTFPDDYQFLNGKDADEIGLNKLGQWIGNAVPPKLAEVVGGSILRHAKGERQMTVSEYVD
ncbi:DNA cytosine methyltransferase [Saliphagus sp. GCM10025317]